MALLGTLSPVPRRPIVMQIPRLLSVAVWIFYDIRNDLFSHQHRDGSFCLVVVDFQIPRYGRLPCRLGNLVLLIGEIGLDVCPFWL